jgi:hypothetical protein
VSDAERHHYLRVLNRLQELAWKYGPPLEPPAEEIATHPTWGPVGVLAARMLTEEDLQHLLAHHRQMIALERSRNPQPPVDEPKGADW